MINHSKAISMSQSKQMLTLKGLNLKGGKLEIRGSCQNHIMMTGQEEKMQIESGWFKLFHPFVLIGWFHFRIEI